MALIFRKVTSKDAYLFRYWGKHQDPRFYQYHFPYEMEIEYLYWFHSKQGLIFRKLYALFDDERPVGFVTLKNINWFKKTAELGIAVDPNHLGKGYGTYLLKAYLNYVFKHFPLRTMYLRVAEFNVRAQKSYKKVGFVSDYKKREEYEEQGYIDEIMEQYPEQFTLKNGVLYAEFITMSINREDFLN